MLPEGISADLLHPSLQRFFLDQYHPARTAVALSHGGCACDLAGRRRPDIAEDERELRAKYRASGASRSLTISALEAHRRRPERPIVPPGHWSAAFAAFVAEHARNAGPALFYLDFTPEVERQPPWPAGATGTVTAHTVREHPASWLPDSQPIVVIP
jgi:hypothetical protein